MSSDPASNLPARLKLARQAHDSLENMSSKASVKAAVIVEHFATYEEEIARRGEEINRLNGELADKFKLEDEVKRLKAEITSIHRQHMQQHGQAY